MKNKVLVMVATVLFSSLMLWDAGKVNALNNGRPFQELNALIQENAAANEANSDAILALSNELSQLDLRVGVLETDVSGLSTRFDTLKGSLDSLKSDFALASTEITSLQNSLAEVSEEVSTNSAALADISNSILLVENTIAQHEIKLQALLATKDEHQAALNDVTNRLSDAEIQLANLDPATDAYQALLIDLNELNDSYASLIAMIETNNTKITETEQVLAIKQSELASLQGEYQTLYDIITTTTAANQQTIDELRASVMDLYDAFNLQKDGISNELSSLQVALSLLANTNNDIAHDLQSQMLALALLVDSDSTSITALHTEVSTLSGTLTLLNTHFNSLNAQYIELKTIFEGLKDAVEPMINLASSLNLEIDGIINTDETGTPYIKITDQYNVYDALVPQIRSWFNENPWTQTRWVYIKFNTGDFRITELCVDDRENAFGSIAQATDQFSSSDFTNTPIYVKVNNEPWRWRGTRVRVKNLTATNIDYFWIIPLSQPSADVFIATRPAGDIGELSESFHQQSYQTVNYREDTDIIFLMGNNRVKVCGF